MSNQLAARLETKSVAKRGDDLSALLNRQQAAIQLSLPSGLDAARFTRNLLTLVKSTPGLRTCDPMSLVQGAMYGAQLGLEPGAALGHFYLVPRKNTAVFQLGYKGLLELVRRGGDIDRIEARAVYAEDEFDVLFGTDARIRHRPNLVGARGEIIAFYSLAVYRGGAEQVAVMRRDEVDRIRDSHAAAKSGPWVSDYEQMGCKTVLRRLCKVLPLKADIAASIATDDQAITVPLSGSMLDDQASKPLVDDVDEPDDIEVTDAEVVDETTPEKPAATPSPAGPAKRAEVAS